MRPLIVNTFLTLDGVMQAPGGPEEDQEEGFDHGGWSVGYWDEAMGEKMGEFMGRPYDLLLGRKTYEIFAAHWPKVEAPEDGGLNAARKHVASRTLDAVEWSNSTLLEGDVGEAVAATLLAGLPDAREVVFEESSHMPALEESGRYLEVVAAFLREAEAT